jgi:hypothetical protein
MYRYARIYLKLGASDLAGQYARRATDVVRELAAADRMSIGPRDDLARSLTALGDVLDVKGDRAGALAAVVRRSETSVSATSDISPGDRPADLAWLRARHRAGDLDPFAKHPQRLAVVAGGALHGADAAQAAREVITYDVVRRPLGEHGAEVVEAFAMRRKRSRVLRTCRGQGGAGQIRRR